MFGKWGLGCLLAFQGRADRTQETWFISGSLLDLLYFLQLLLYLLELIIDNGLKPIGNLLQLELKHLRQKFLSIPNLVAGLVLRNKHQAIPNFINKPIDTNPWLYLIFPAFLLVLTCKHLLHHILEHHPKYWIIYHLLWEGVVQYWILLFHDMFWGCCMA